MAYLVRDIEGERFGCLTAVRFDHRKNNKYYWLCKCDCGKECYVNRYNLISGKTQSCGHLRANALTMTRGKFRKVEITDQQKEWIIKHFCHTKNQDIKDKFGLTDGWLHRFARENGLKKTKQFLRKCQKNAAEMAYESHERNSSWPPKGYRIPGSAKGGFKPGSPRKETKKQKQLRISRSTATMRDIRLSERARIRMGWPQRTKLNIKLYPDTKRRICFRYNLRKRGYIVARGSDIAYYDENTRRSRIMENRKPGDRLYIYFTFKPKETNT